MAHGQHPDGVMIQHAMRSLYEHNGVSRFGLSVYIDIAAVPISSRLLSSYKTPMRVSLPEADRSQTLSQVTGGLTVK